MTSSEEGLGLSALPKLMGSNIKPETALLWFEKMEAYCTAKGFDAALEGEANLPTDSDPTTDDDALKARKRNKQCMAALVLGITCADHLTIITNSKSTEHPKGKASLVWTALKEKYAPMDDLSEIEMQQDLKTVTMKADEDPQVLFDKIGVIQTKYSGFVPISSALQIATIVAAAPSKYQSTILNEKRSKGTALTVKEVKTAMTQLYRALHIADDKAEAEEEEDKPKGKELALAAFSGECRKCGKKGHKAADCRRRGRGRGKKKGKCFHCHKSGHHKDDCWILGKIL